MSFFISNAMAAAKTASTGQADGTLSMVMVVAIFILFYFMLIRPQSKRAKEQRELISSLKKGDEIITNSGLLAKVISLDNQYIKIALTEGVEVYLQRGAVGTILPKGTLKSL